MKQYFLLLFLCVSFTAFAQPRIDSTGVCVLGDDDKVFTKSETPPSFPKSKGKMEAYLKKNFNTQAPIQNGASKGKYKISLRFIVLKTGDCCDFYAESLNGFGIEQEAVRVLKNGPKWNHAIQNGYPVNAYARQTFEIEL